MRPASDVSRRINAERLLLVAWLRAILLQLAHPLIAAGVADHSTFRGSPVAAFARLRHTINAMLALTFGTEVEREAAVGGIRAIHRRVHGVLPAACGRFAAGTRYSANDPALLTWVHATLIESMVLTYEQLVEPLTAGERNRYCEDAAELAVALGASSREVPRSWDALNAYLERMYLSGEIAVGQQSRTLAATLVCAGGGWLSRQVVAPATSFIAAGLLPPHVRMQYGFVWSRRRERRYLRTVALLRRIRRALPVRFTQWERARLVDCMAIRRDYPAAAR
ncbi:MAG TPA: oxygenase MpaB family protein [Vicinamibacterales bacterium]|nr:oxygenase MpaB family protein [Vicinamibacterales bacterium]